MTFMRGLLALAIATGLAGLAELSAAQRIPPDTVMVNVAVTAAKKAPVTGLAAQNFQIWEDGVEQKISYFSEADGGWDLNLILAVDALQLGRADRMSIAIRDAVDGFHKSANPQTRVDTEELHFGSDGLFAAIDRHLVTLQKSANPRRALIVVTDGFDTPGGDPANALIEFSRKLNIPIYIVFVEQVAGATSNMGATSGQRITAPQSSIIDGGPTRGGLYSLPGGEAFTNVAEQTGGKIYFVEPERQLGVQLDLLAAEMRSEYVVGFRSTNDAKNDKWRKLKVKVNPPAGQKMDVSAKSKYFVPKPLGN